MKKLFIVILISSLFHRCAEGTGSYPAGFEGVIDNSGESQLSQLIFTVDLVYEDSLYLLCDSLFDVEIYLNNHLWGIFHSGQINPEAFDYESFDGNRLTTRQVQYLFVANDQTSVDSLKTAGDYAMALNDLLSISPGDYVAEIRTVSWLNENGETTSQPVRDLIPFTLEPDVETLYLGDFILNLKL